MFENLLESGAKKQTTIGQGVLSAVIHVVLIYGAIEATRSAAQVVQGIIQDTSAVFLTPPPPPPPPPPDMPPPEAIVTANPPPQGFQTVMPPAEIPTTIPPVNLSERFDARDFSGKGVEGGIATGIVGGTGAVPTVTGETFLDSQVDDPVQPINIPRPRYPPVLQQAGVSGRVEMEYVVDTTGHAEPNSIRITSSTNAQFEAPAREAILKAVFKPARIRGQAVRQLVRQAMSFTIGQ
jgi:protein TonB